MASLPGARKPNPSQASRVYWNTHADRAEYAGESCPAVATPEFFARIRPWMSPYRFPWIMDRIEREAAALRGKRLLDVGCGLGFDALEFMRRGVRVSVIDISAHAVALAWRHFAVSGVRPDVASIADALSLPFADETFDAVWSDGVLYYTGDMPGALHEIWRVLRPGGRAIVSHLRRRPSWLDLLSRLGHERIEFKDTEPPVSEARSEREILAMFDGFQVVEKTRDQFRARPIARRGWKAALYRRGFRPLYNAIPRAVAERWASKLSVTALKIA
jgi:SAM-dependent methyltransferase